MDHEIRVDITGLGRYKMKLIGPGFADHTLSDLKKDKTV